MSLELPIDPLRTATGEPDNRAFGFFRWFQVDAAETDGALSSWIEEVPPGGGPPLHVHTLEVETFTLLEGSLQFALDDRSLTAKAGETVVIPKGTPHTFHNASNTVARALVSLTPGGGERFFRDVEAEGLGPGDMSRIEEIGSEYGLDFAGPPLG